MKNFNQKLTSLAVILLMLSFQLLSVDCKAQWNQIGGDIDGEAANDNSGSSVSLSSDGNTLAIGAISNSGNGALAGHVRVYHWNGTSWGQQGIDLDGEAANDQSGFSVSLSSNGNIVAIGAALNDGNGSNSGHVRIYNWTGTAWMQQGTDIDGEAANDQSGFSVSLSSDGNTVAIGAIGNSGTASAAGHVRIYDWTGTAWVQQGEDIDGEAANDRSGWSVSLSSDGNTLAIGSALNDGNGTSSGHVRVYGWTGTTWMQQGADIDGEAAGDQLGGSVSLSSDGNTLAIGAQNNDGAGSDAGHTRVYNWNGTTWTQQGNDIDGEAANDKSGSSVSLSSDGNRIAIGAKSNNGSAPFSGHVRVYYWTGSAWMLEGPDIDGEATGDESGGSVSLSSNGNTVAIGAISNNGNGIFAGQVRVYSQVTVGVDEVQTPEVRVYPNPANEVLIIENGHLLAPIDVFNALGKKVMSTKITSDKHNLNVSALSKGMYTIRFETEDGIIETHQLVKE